MFDSPTAAPDSFGFVSLLGLAFGIAYAPIIVPEPTITLGLVGVGVWGVVSRRRPAAN